MDSVIFSALEVFPAQFEQMLALIPAVRRHGEPEPWGVVPSEMPDPFEQICHVHDIDRQRLAGLQWLLGKIDSAELAQ